MTHHSFAAFTFHLPDLCSLHKHAETSFHKKLNMICNWQCCMTYIHHRMRECLRLQGWLLVNLLPVLLSKPYSQIISPNGTSALEVLGLVLHWHSCWKFICLHSSLAFPTSWGIPHGELHCHPAHQRMSRCAHTPHYMELSSLDRPRCILSHNCRDSRSSSAASSLWILIIPSPIDHQEKH